MLHPRLLPATLLLACGLMSRPAAAYPVNFGNSYVPAPSHGVLLAIPSVAVDGSATSGWGYADLGVAERLSVTVDSLYLHLPGLARDFGTTYVGLGYASQPTPWMTTRLNPLIGLKSGQFGQPQIGLRGYVDFQLPHGLTLFTMPAYYQALEGTFEPVFAFDAALEKQLSPFLSVALEVLAGTPSWEFGTNTRLAVAPAFSLTLGAYSLQASLRTPIVPSRTATSLETPTGAVCLGYSW